jgi:ribonuclease-3
MIVPNTNKEYKVATLVKGKEANLDSLQRKIGYDFRNRGLLEEALTHRSFTHEHPELSLNNNERLEFLGDAVLALSLSHLLVNNFPNLLEGSLSKTRAGLVNEGHLAKLASGLRLGSFLRMGRGEELTGGRKKPSILADTLEALLGAVFLDSDLAAAHSLVQRLFEGDLFDQAGLSRQDFKTLLQEYCQSELKGTPTYNVLREEGPDHQKVFFVEVRVKDKGISRGKGRTKKEAQQKAAEKALKRLTKPIDF